MSTLQSSIIWLSPKGSDVLQLAMTKDSGSYCRASLCLVDDVHCLVTSVRSTVAISRPIGLLSPVLFGSKKVPLYARLILALRLRALKPWFHVQ